MFPVHRSVTETVHHGQLQLYNTAIARHKEVTLLIGDSVMERLVWFAHKVFPPHVVLLAKGGDKTGHLLWRIQNTPDSDNVTRIILHIGTNNIEQSKQRSAKPVCEAIHNVVRILHEKYKHAHIYLIPLYYRGDVDPELITHINRGTAAVKNAEVIHDFWEDIVPQAYDPTRFALGDLVHLNTIAYNDFYLKLMTYI